MVPSHQATTFFTAYQTNGLRQVSSLWPRVLPNQGLTDHLPTLSCTAW